MNNRRSMNDFCQDIIRLLTGHGIHFLVGGYDAFRDHTGISRETKDFDLITRPADVAGVIQLCREAGFGADWVFKHWLAKIHDQENFIDLIFNSGNGVCAVDDIWFARAPVRLIFDLPVKIIPVEELLWQKAYIMERERYDGADIAHLLLKCANQIDWKHLLYRFGPDWRVLLTHLLLFGFIYPAKRELIPGHVLTELLKRVETEQQSEPPAANVCNGPLLSRSQFISDVGENEFRDGRLSDRNAMTEEDIKEWTAAAVAEQQTRRSLRP
jgi:hypothetical protein